MAYQQQGWQQRGQNSGQQQQQNGGQQEKPVFVKLTGLYAKNDKEGNLMMQGKLSISTRLVISVNRFKKKDTDPDFYASICKAEQQQQNGGQQQQQQQQAGGQQRASEADEAEEFGF